MTMDDVGTLNTGWGICGFTSSLYALYTHNPAQRARLSVGGVTTTMMLAEIKTYLRILQADGRQSLLDDITAFTRSFGGVHAHFTITKYIERINKTVTKAPDSRNEKFGIGLPPHVVVDYMKRVCDFDNAREVPLDSTANELILGVYDSKGTMRMYGGLAHYLYYLNGNIFSWGKQFGSVAHAMNMVGIGKNWRISQKIAL